MKKNIIIQLLMLFVFFGFFLLTYNFKTIKADSSQSFWSLKSIFKNDNNGLVTKNTKAETYYNDCITPYTDKQFIEYQFGDIVLRHPCSVRGQAASLYIGKTKTSITKNYNLRLDIKWSKESGLVWWNDGFLNENYNKYKEYEFDFYGRLFFQKQGHSKSLEQDVIYQETLAPSYTNYKLPTNAILLENNDIRGISIHELPLNIKNSRIKTVIIELDDVEDERSRGIYLYCGNVNIKINTLERIRQNIKIIDVIRQTVPEPECSTGWYITESTYVKFVGMSLSKVDLFKQIYKEVNTQLKSFIVPNEEPIKSQ